MREEERECMRSDEVAECSEYRDRAESAAGTCRRSRQEVPRPHRYARPATALEFVMSDLDRAVTESSKEVVVSDKVQAIISAETGIDCELNEAVTINLKVHRHKILAAYLVRDNGEAEITIATACKLYTELRAANVNIASHDLSASIGEFFKQEQAAKLSGDSDKGSGMKPKPAAKQKSRPPSPLGFEPAVTAAFDAS